MTDKTPEEIAYGHNKGDHVVSPYSDPNVVKNGFTYDEGRKLGFIGPDEAPDFKMGVVSIENDPQSAELGESALGAVGIEEKPTEIKIEEPSAETVNYWPEEFKYIETADGTNWLCAIDSKDNVFAKIKATASSDAGNTKMLLEVTQPILNEYRQNQRTLFDDAETTLGKAA